MSLQVWLPLNGDLTQQGLSGIEVTNNGATVDNEGKIGKCYNFDKTFLSFPNPLNNPCSEFSIAAWVNLTEGYAKNNGLHICSWNGTYSRICISKDGAAVRVLLASNGIFSSTALDTSITANVWNHYTITFKNQQLNIYINGILDKSINTGLTEVTFASNTIFIGTYSSETSKGKVNDVRIYDHCLSSKEVKIISQGLILHYPLNNNGYGRKNNIAITNITNRSCTNFSYNSIINEWTMTCPTGSSSWGYGIYINNSSIKWKANETWIISMEVYVPKTINWQRDINNKPDLSDISGYTGNDYDVNAQRYVYTNDVGNQILKPGWNKIWFSQTAPDTYGLSNFNTNWGIVTTNETSNIDIKIRNIKGEIASIGEVIKPTTWSPNIQDSLEQDNIIYDTSGYCNNGTARGTLVTSNDTSKYDCSTEFNGTDNTILVPYDANIWQTNFTINIWFKKNELGTKNYETLFGGPSGFEMDTRTYNATTLTLFMTSARGGNITGNNFSSFNFSEWYMVTLVNDGTNELYYVNGNFVKSITKKSMPVGQYYIGSWNTATSQNYKGLISDFRIYATALSAEDIAELYSVGASIDNQGNVYSAMIQEV